MKLKTLLATVCCLFIVFSATAQSALPKVLDLQERAQVEEEILEERIRTILPDLMERSGIDLWLLISREYNEDPVLKTLLPPTWLSARRTTMLVMYYPEGADSVECLAVARYDVGSVFKKAWNPEEEPDQWKRLAEIIAERDPEQIGVNTSEHFAQADGLAHTDYLHLMDALSTDQAKKVTSAENLAIGWLETRTEREVILYEHIARIAHHIIAEGFSEKVVHPGITTTEEVVWWYRNRVNELGLDTWFHPTVDVQRSAPENQENQRSFSQRPDKQVIMPGDLLHVDFGITYLDMNTDTQENAYVLKPGETEAPPYLRKAHQTALRLMDILTDNFRVGRTGNEILLASIEEAKAEGIKPTIYTHPIGYYGHGSGPTIGLWDQQGGVPVKGDYPMYSNTAYSIELNAAVFIPEWDKEVRMMMEEDAFFDGKKVRYLDGRQKELFLIPRQRVNEVVEY
ncbi:MAG: M24 family metallopeptidase [Tunicatimonas sp.]|uniref:M24 family metallopeptidase n=1 Tax=Tunicatimonas sp. TaxID=1940096 RepID=UPI003C7683F0